jgi:hypothetical protein
MPDVEPIVATELLLLLQVPPGEISFNVVVTPWQKAVIPVIGAGSGFTVNATVDAQPVESV